MITENTRAWAAEYQKRLEQDAQDAQRHHEEELLSGFLDFIHGKTWWDYASRVKLIDDFFITRVYNSMPKPSSGRDMINKAKAII